ncbi:MAG: hypothetical protein EOP02_33765, partial [Proteobacteria bacterium]
MHLPYHLPIPRRHWAPVLALLVAALLHPVAAQAVERIGAEPQRQADFSGQNASDDAHLVANWVVRSGDNRGLSFIVVDKASAELFLFDASGSIRAATPVLLGLAVGDDSPPGIGSQPLAAIK